MNGNGKRRRGPRSNAERVRGLLDMLPWLMAREKVSVADMARQFDVSEETLIADLELAAMCGIPPYSPAELTGVWIEDGVIHVDGTRMFERRLELTASEAFGLSLLAAAADDLPGFRTSKPLRSALTKIRKVLGDSVVDVDVEAPEHLSTVSRAAETGERLRLTYWTPSRNEESERTVTVRAVFSDKGHWYVTADDDLTGSVRHFRVDRIRAAERTGEIAAVPTVAPVIPDWFADASHGPTVTLEVSRSAGWVVETYPCTVLEERPDGTVVVNMVANSDHWLGRLLLRAGDGVRVTAPADKVDLASRVAAQVLERYRPGRPGN